NVKGTSAGWNAEAIDKSLGRAFGVLRNLAEVARHPGGAHALLDLLHGRYRRTHNSPLRDVVVEGAFPLSRLSRVPGRDDLDGEHDLAKHLALGQILVGSACFTERE